MRDDQWPEEQVAANLMQVVHGGDGGSGSGIVGQRRAERLVERVNGVGTEAGGYEIGSVLAEEEWPDVSRDAGADAVGHFLEDAP